jgi:hypothetical protein
MAFWAAGLPVIMNPSHGLAVSGITVVSANLYFFSWLSFGTALYLSASLAQEKAQDMAQKVQVHLTTKLKTARWYGLAAASIVVAVASIRILAIAPCNSSLDFLRQGEFCKRTKLGVSIGILSFVVSLTMSFVTAKMSDILVYEMITTTLLLGFWCFGVGYITFGSSPGSQIGNIYFSSWISFVQIVFLFAECFRDVVLARMSSHNANATTDKENDPEVPSSLHNDNENNDMSSHPE